MNFPYIVRLLLLSLASFFQIHLLFAMLLIAMRHPVMVLAARLRPRQATRFLLSIRLFPATFTALIVAGLCVPSYLWLEPDASSEPVGAWCLAAAFLGAAILIHSVARASWSVVRSMHQLRQYEKKATVESILGSRAVIIDGRGPVFALAGILNPRLLISRDILNVLSGELLTSALDHEIAHRRSRDNLKRLIMSLMPDVLPFARGMKAFEAAWAKFTEWAADDEAVAGNPERSVSLARALIQVARLGIAPDPVPLATSLLGADHDLSERVHRLLRFVAPEHRQRTPALVLGILVLLSAAVVWSMAEPATLLAAHGVLEQMLLR